MKIKLTNVGFLNRNRFLMNVMKIFVFLFCTTVFSLTPYNLASQNSKIKIDEDKVLAVDEVFDLIMEQTDYKFFYEEGIFNDLPKVQVKKGTIKTNKLLNLSLSNANLSVVVTPSKGIVITKKPLENLQNPIQDYKVTGTVTDEKGIPLLGASIIEKGTTNGTQTDFDGNFSLKVNDENAILVISYVGFEIKEISLNGKTNIEVQLKESAESLEEVVIVGYGTQSKRKVTGAVTTVDAENLHDLPVTGADQLLQGQAAGVQVSQSNSAPGGAVKVSIRGSVSINSNAQPLYVIDGFPISNVDNQTSNPLSNLNPNDIESIQVLKDASATAIYGSRASNGVILVSTKKGKLGKTEFNVDIYSGVQNVQRKVDMLNAREFATLYVESRNNSYIDFFGDQGAQITDTNEQRAALGASNGIFYQIDPELADPSQYGEGTDWQDEIFRTAPITNVQIGARGGTEKVKYYISGGYFDQEGVVIESGFKRFSFNTSMDAKVTEKLKMGFNINSSYSKNQIVNAEGSWHQGGIVSSALMMSPTLPVIDTDGNYSNNNSFVTFGFVDLANPVQTARELDRNSKLFRTTGTFFGEYQLLNNLLFKTTLGADFFSYTEDKYSPNFLSPRVRGGNTAYKVQNTFLNYLSEFTLNYSKSFNGHNIGALAGYTVQKEESTFTRVEASDFPNDLVRDVEAGVISDYSSNPQEWSLISFLGRITYDYNSKYLIEASIRRDGSSRFGENNRYGNFPSASIGWRASEEKFMDDVSFIDELKFRYSWGITGNNAIGNYSSIGLLTPSNYVVNGNVELGQRKNTLPNPELTWEPTTQWNVGMELGLFKDRLYITADYYEKLTKDLLLNVPVSDITGVSSFRDNLGEISNKGWELSFISKNLVGNFNWSTNFNISSNRNRVESLGESNATIFVGTIAGASHVAAVGSPIGSYWGLQWDGLYLNEEELANQPENRTGGRAAFVGDVRWKDLNGDNIIDDEDRGIIGDWEPDFVYGITNNFSYKNIDLSIFIQGSQGNEIYNIQRRNLANRVIFGNEYTESLIRWQSPQNPGNGQLPKLKRAFASNSTTRSSDYYIDDASYMSIKNITLGYTFPDMLIKQLNLSRLRGYISVQNAFLFTDYINYNPEVNATNTTSAYNTDINPLTPGIDYGSYPLARTITMGLNVSF